MRTTAVSGIWVWVWMSDAITDCSRTFNSEYAVKSSIVGEPSAVEALESGGVAGHRGIHYRFSPL